ncbi:Uncharacterized protein Adt_29012 [Abeliophyllum distichum]|uniref:Uncharacterized protein n=1 Tax=Abeliophyllum distichum TaxID=126358 RepID=A0ABD1RY62_9LAMI
MNYHLNDGDGETPTTIKTSMEYLIIDKSFSYHGVLGRSTLIDLGAVTYTKFLCMKFSTDCGVAIVKKNQFESRACYTNVMRKFVDREVHVIDSKMEEVSLDLERMDRRLDDGDEHMRYLEDPDDLDLRVVEKEPQASPAERLKYFHVDPFDPVKEL